jgi:FixJ family two-component response regulator
MEARAARPPDMPRGKVYLIEDDDSVRKALHRLIGTVGFAVESFPDVAGYLTGPAPMTRACIVVDVWMPVMTGFELQRAISGTTHDLPIVFITGHGGEDIRSRAMAAGAVELLFKPIDEEALLGAIEKALDGQR